MVFVVGEQCIEGQEYPHAPSMTIDQSLLKLFVRKVLGAPAGIEITPAEINRVRAVLDGGPEGFRGTGGGEQFRTISHLR